MKEDVQDHLVFSPFIFTFFFPRESTEGVEICSSACSKDSNREEKFTANVCSCTQTGRVHCQVSAFSIIKLSF